MKTYEEKVAAFGDALREMPGQFGRTLQQGFATAAAGAVIGGAGMAASKLYDAATKGRDFRNMLRADPELREMHAANPQSFNRMFTSLRNANPNFSKDPLIAGHYMRLMNQDPQGAGGFLMQAVQERDRFQNGAAMDMYQKGGLEGAKAYTQEAMRQPFQQQMAAGDRAHRMQEIGQQHKYKIDEINHQNSLRPKRPGLGHQDDDGG